MEFLIFIVLISSLLCGSESPTIPKKVQLSEDLLDQLNAIEKIYGSFLRQGMSPYEAALNASQWQSIRYPVRLGPVPEEYRTKEEPAALDRKKEKKIRKED